MSYSITQTPLKDVFIVTPRVFEDTRGYFYEAYQQEKLSEIGIDDDFVQDNEAQSARGVLRGLHYQVDPQPQSKLLRVVRGSIYDVVVDIRPDSPSYGKWYGVELSAANKKQIYVPEGFAHGYLALEDNTTLVYKCNNYYSRDCEGGIRYDCPKLNIEWPSVDGGYILSDKDRELPFLGNHRT